jgi:hypothetical protein
MAVCRRDGSAVTGESVRVDVVAPETTSLADHQAVFGPPDPSLEGDAKVPVPVAASVIRLESAGLDRTSPGHHGYVHDDLVRLNGPQDDRFDGRVLPGAANEGAELMQARSV